MFGKRFFDLALLREHIAPGFERIGRPSAPVTEPRTRIGTDRTTSDNCLTRADTDRC
jgi:hypothetical protein